MNSNTSRMLPPRAAWHWLAALWLLVAAVLSALPSLALAQVPTAAAPPRVLPVPALSARVIDQTGTLDGAQRAGLEAKLAAFEQRKGSQIAVLMVPTTQPEDIESYANRVGNDWKIGRKDVGDGMLVVVAKDDRRMRIEVAKTLEGAVPDLAAARIIDEEMKPRFRNGDFAGGLNAAVDRLIGLVDGEPLPEPTQSSTQRSGFGFDWEDFAIFLFLGFFVVAPIVRRVLGKKLGTVAMGGGMGVVAFLITGSIFIAVVAALIALVTSSWAGTGPLTTGSGGRGGWRSGSSAGGWSGGSSSSSSDWSSSSSSDSFSSGGGGDFGGGGASGDW